MPKAHPKGGMEGEGGEKESRRGIKGERQGRRLEGEGSVFNRSEGVTRGE